MADLWAQGFRAVFLGVGAMRSRDLAVPGIELDGVLRGVDYLLNVNLGYKVEMGRRVVVIGGGNVAVDVARTAARGGEQENLQRNLSVVQALDVARSACGNREFSYGPGSCYRRAVVDTALGPVGRRVWVCG